MTIYQYISAPPVGVAGTKVLFASQPEVLRGQCVQLVEDYAVKVLGAPLPVLTNAKDYWKALPGYTQIAKTSPPQVGDIGVYDGHPNFPQGHINFYAGSGQFFEQNADPDGSPAHLAARASTYLLGYQRKGNMIKITKENENLHSILATGEYPGKDYDYRFVGTEDVDGMGNFWLNISQTEGLIFKAQNPPPAAGFTLVTEPVYFKDIK